MCHPDWNERRNHSMTIFIFEGSGNELGTCLPQTGKGLTLTCSGALVHRPRQDWADGPSQPLMRLDSPTRSLENESRGGALPFWE